MASRVASAKRIESAVAVHWFTFYTHVHKRLPALGPQSRDADALHDIAVVQAAGHVDRALELIEEIVRAPIPGDTLRGRYLAFWAWWESQRPKRYTPASRSITADNRRCIRGGA